MSVKITPTELGLRKAVEVKESNKNIRATWELQKLMAKLSIDQASVGDNEDAFEDMLDMMLDVQTKVIAYITDTLKLNEKAQEALEELDFNDTMTFAIRISSELLHIKAEPATEVDTGLEG